VTSTSDVNSTSAK